MGKDDRAMAIWTLVMAVWIVFVLAMLACDDKPDPRIHDSNTGPGTVRNVWSHGLCYYVTFESDRDGLYVYDFDNQPAVWTGLRADMYYHFDPGDGRWPKCQFELKKAVRVQ